MVELQEVKQPAGMDPWDCGAAFSAFSKISDTAVPDMAQLLRQTGASDKHQQSSGLDEACVRSEERGSEAAERPVATENEAVQQQDETRKVNGSGSNDAGTSDGQSAAANNSFGKAVKPQHCQYVALCEYIGALSCRIRPLAVQELGVCAKACVEVRSWTGLLAGTSVPSIVAACRAELLREHRAWTVVLMHGFRSNPFCWNSRQSDDTAMQRVPGVGVKNCGVGGTPGPGRESIGAVVILPGGAVCLMCMSGEGDNFCNF